MASSKKFETTIERFEGMGTWTFANIPFDCEKEFGTKGRIKVQGSLNGHKIESTLMPHGDGKHFIILSKEIRNKAKIAAGDKIELLLRGMLSLKK